MSRGSAAIRQMLNRSADPMALATLPQRVNLYRRCTTFECLPGVGKAFVLDLASCHGDRRLTIDVKADRTRLDQSVDPRCKDARRINRLIAVSKAPCFDLVHHPPLGT